ncbi:hypothetical protein C3N91_16195 [Salmonella enterica subsp. enterica serovar Aberdeen]|nr:hypothetical protein [Salmonella enterica subsp. enterica serovar Aberdeen]EHO3779104.1 hypothetical protein [Salmonella enterica]
MKRKTPTIKQIVAASVCAVAFPLPSMIVGTGLIIAGAVQASRKETKELESTPPVKPVVKQPVVKSKYTLQMEEETRRFKAMK